MPGKKKNGKRRRGNASARANVSSAFREEHSMEAGKGKTVVVKGQITPKKELKFVDVAIAGYNYDTTGTVTALNLIAEGDDFTNRNSRSAIMVSVAIRGLIASQPSAGVNSLAQKARTLLVWDNAPNGALAAVTDILTVANAEAFPNVNNEKRFTIVWDKSVVIGPYNTIAATAAGTIDKSCMDIEGLVYLHAPTAFNGTAAAITSIQNGVLLMVTVGTIAAAATTVAGVISTRVRFLENDSN